MIPDKRHRFRDVVLNSNNRSEIMRLRRKVAKLEKFEEAARRKHTNLETRITVLEEA